MKRLMREKPMASEVRVVLMGGLGNQLFQYFAGSMIREFMRIPLVVDHSGLKFHHHHSDSNLSELRIYNISKYLVD